MRYDWPNELRHARSPLRTVSSRCSSGVTSRIIKVSGSRRRRVIHSRSTGKIRRQRDLSGPEGTSSATTSGVTGGNKSRTVGKPRSASVKAPWSESGDDGPLPGFSGAVSAFRYDGVYATGFLSLSTIFRPAGRVVSDRPRSMGAPKLSSTNVPAGRSHGVRSWTMPSPSASLASGS